MCLLYCDDGYETVPTVLFIFIEKYLLVPNNKSFMLNVLIYFILVTRFISFIRSKLLSESDYPFGIIKLFLSPLSYTGNTNNNIILNICALCLIYKRYLPQIKAIFK